MDWEKRAKCKEENCWEEAKRRGWCDKHYLKFYKSHPDYKAVKYNHYNRNHPLYIIWWGRFSANMLCEMVKF